MYCLNFEFSLSGTVYQIHVIKMSKEKNNKESGKIKINVLLTKAYLFNPNNLNIYDYTYIDH